MPSDSETPSVVIIGAGAAGLSSVRQLVDLGFPAESLVILEGQDRIGGRIHTILHGDNLFCTPNDLFSE